MNAWDGAESIGANDTPSELNRRDSNSWLLVLMVHFSCVNRMNDRKRLRIPGLEINGERWTSERE